MKKSRIIKYISIGLALSSIVFFFLPYRNAYGNVNYNGLQIIQTMDEYGNGDLVAEAIFRLLVPLVFTVLSGLLLIKTNKITTVISALLSGISIILYNDYIYEAMNDSYGIEIGLKINYAISIICFILPIVIFVLLFIESKNRSAKKISNEEAEVLLNKMTNPEWVCECGCKNTGKYCQSCGKEKVVTIPAHKVEEKIETVVEVENTNNDEKEEVVKETPIDNKPKTNKINLTPDQKKIGIVVICVALVVVIIGVVALNSSSKGDSKKEELVSETKKETPKKSVNTSLDDIVDEIKKDEEDTVSRIQSEYDKITSSITTYEEYKNNVSKFDEFYAYVMSESEDFYKRTRVNYAKYYREAESTIDHEDLYTEIDDIFDAVYSEAYDDFLDDIYSGILDETLDDYYSGIIDEGSDDADYYDISSDFYDKYSDCSSDFYDLWSDESGYFYDKHSDISSAILDEDFDKMLEIVSKIEEDSK